MFINREAAVWNYTIDICVYNWAGPGVQRCLGMQEHAYYIAATLLWYGTVFIDLNMQLISRK